ncbi:hypothetical protein [Haloglomus litoreum]|uniref:hypothetical protein n=1 Tax=Haloglomus litoreum TaxID=3034026 RepID=UPI0023E879F7|nr:hypothetical protein [Haloglomus sp. DT116]
MSDLDGARVAVTLDGERRTGEVVRTTYTTKYGQPLVAVALDEPLPDGRDRYLARADAVERV